MPKRSFPLQINEKKSATVFCLRIFYTTAAVFHIIGEFIQHSTNVWIIIIYICESVCAEIFLILMVILKKILWVLRLFHRLKFAKLFFPNKNDLMMIKFVYFDNLSNSYKNLAKVILPNYKRISTLSLFFFVIDF